MAKVIFEFDIYEDREELKLYSSIDRLYFALDEIYNIVRNELKHGSTPLNEDVQKLLEKVKCKAGVIHNLEDEL